MSLSRLYDSYLRLISVVVSYVLAPLLSRRGVDAKHTDAKHADAKHTFLL